MGEWLQGARKLIEKHPVASTLTLGVIGSAIFTIFFEPMAKAARELLFGLFGNVAGSIADQVFERAAGDPRGFTAVATFILLLGFVYVMTIWQWVEISDLQRRARRVAERIDNIGAEQPARTKDEVKAEVADTSRSIRRTQAWFLVAIVFQVGLSLRELVMAMLSVALANGFQERIDVIGPLLEPQELSSIQLEWNSIRTRQQYVALMKRIEGLAAAEGIKLPATEIRVKLAPPPSRS